MTVKMFQDLRKIMEAKIEKMQEMFTKDLEELKNRDTLEGINSRIFLSVLTSVCMLSCSVMSNSL